MLYPLHDLSVARWPQWILPLCCETNAQEYHILTHLVLMLVSPDFVGAWTCAHEAGPPTHPRLGNVAYEALRYSIEQGMWPVRQVQPS